MARTKPIRTGGIIMAMTKEQLEAMGGAIHELQLFSIRNKASYEFQFALASLQEIIEREISKSNVSQIMNRNRIIRNRMEMTQFVHSTPAAKQEPENDNYIRCKNPNHTCRSNGVCLTCNP